MSQQDFHYRQGNRSYAVENTNPTSERHPLVSHFSRRASHFNSCSESFIRS